MRQNIITRWGQIRVSKWAIPEYRTHRALLLVDLQNPSAIRKLGNICNDKSLARLELGGPQARPRAGRPFASPVPAPRLTWIYPALRLGN